MKKLLSTVLLFVVVIAAQAQNAGIDKIADAYIAVKDALVASNATLAKTRAKDLSNALKSPVKGLQPAQQKLLSAYAGKLQAGSLSISQTNSIDSQRTQFETLSKNMYSLLSGLKLNKAPLYQQYCPMKKASWLSKDEDIL